MEGLRAKLSEMCAAYDKAVQYVLEVNNPEYTDFMARRLVEMAGNIVMGHLLVLDANRNEAFIGSANVYINMGQAEVAKHADYIASVSPEQMQYYKA